MEPHFNPVGSEAHEDCSPDLGCFSHRLFCDEGTSECDSSEGSSLWSR